MDPTTQLGGHFIMPEADFENNGSTSATGSPLEAPLSGSNGTTDDSALVPNFYYSTPLNDTVSFGFGINAPFGLTSEYDDDWVGRYHATNSELQTININPSIAFQATDKLSLGFGVNYQSIDATLENEVDSFAACFAARRAVGGPTGCCS
ncbi:MAG: outer membrane protein transport protein [Halofilum sp. (in: g-proteobacteria)]|nr:outer membrane protein transport protein [Halofilum sp. (in: g-proteobacteria)]